LWRPGLEHLAQPIVTYNVAESPLLLFGSLSIGTYTKALVAKKLASDNINFKVRYTFASSGLPLRGVIPMIREANFKDVPAIRELMKSVPDFWQRDWSDETIIKAIGAAADLALVWEENAQIVGFVCAHDLGFRAYLSELVVTPSKQRRGIGKALIRHIEMQLAERGVNILIADVWHDAAPFYRTLGWGLPDIVLLRRKLR
jgi:predicted N-acetyltransferase YhbS